LATCGGLVKIRLQELPAHPDVEAQSPCLPYAEERVKARQADSQLIPAGTPVEDLMERNYNKSDMRLAARYRGRVSSQIKAGIKERKI
jgi:hypothetical protein